MPSVRPWTGPRGRSPAGSCCSAPAWLSGSAEFFRRHAIHTGRPQVVTDPDGTRLFHPDGRIIPNPGPNDFRPTPPQPPSTPESVGRDRVLVGAAAGADVGWSTPGQEDR